MLEVVKKDLIINQIAAKELFVAKYYISVQKWIPAINRFKRIIKEFFRMLENSSNKKKLEEE